MPNFEGFRGAFRILSIDIGTGFLPVACLTDNNFFEETDLLPTTTRESGGWDTSRPTRQRYNLDFAGLQINSIFPGATGTQISYDQLRILKRERTQINWQIESMDANQLVESGRGYINTLSEAASVGEMVSFSGNITGFATPDVFDLTFTLDPTNGTILTFGSVVDEVFITYNSAITKSPAISGIVTNLTASTTLIINDINTNVGGNILTIDTAGFIDPIGQYLIELNAGAVFDSNNLGRYSPAITNYMIYISDGGFDSGFDLTGFN